MPAYAVVEIGGHPWGSARSITLLTAGAALLGYFLVHERFIAADQLMPLSLWRNRSVAGDNLVTALQSSAVFAMFYSTTLYQQQVLGYSALRTGLAYPARPVHPGLRRPRPGAAAADRCPVHHVGRSAGIHDRPGAASRAAGLRKRAHSGHATPGRRLLTIRAKRASVRKSFTPKGACNEGGVIGLVITATQYPLDEVLFAGDRIDGFPV
jgi:hypothetical protein